MSFNKGMLLSLCICIPTTVNAANTSYPLTTFAIKPLSCVVSKVGDSCQLNATVEWTADKSIDVCLLQNKAELYCWTQSTRGRKVIPVEITETSNFELIQKSAMVLASQKVAISSMQPKTKRRRLRSGWSIF